MNPSSSFILPTQVLLLSLRFSHAVTLLCVPLQSIPVVHLFILYLFTISPLLSVNLPLYCQHWISGPTCQSLSFPPSQTIKPMNSFCLPRHPPTSSHPSMSNNDAPPYFVLHLVHWLQTLGAVMAE